MVKAASVFIAILVFSITHWAQTWSLHLLQPGPHQTVPCSTVPCCSLGPTKLPTGQETWLEEGRKWRIWLIELFSWTVVIQECSCLAFQWCEPTQRSQQHLRKWEEVGMTRHQAYWIDILLNQLYHPIRQTLFYQKIWLEMAGNGRKWLERLVWLEMPGNDLKWL